MADIYSRAIKVLMWLGPESQDSSRALLCLNYIASKVNYDWSTGELSAITDEVHWADRDLFLPLAEEDWPAIHQLIHRPWFERLWIRQAVLLASNDPQLKCGQVIVLWSSMRTAIACLYLKRLSLPKDVQAFKSRLRLVFEPCHG
jgi:hypothetical protein